MRPMNPLAQYEPREVPRRETIRMYSGANGWTPPQEGEIWRPGQ
jgi:hypothetical protein